VSNTVFLNKGVYEIVRNWNSEFHKRARVQRCIENNKGWNIIYHRRLYSFTLQWFKEPVWITQRACLPHAVSLQSLLPIQLVHMQLRRTFLLSVI